jgi:hypothetical protein
VEYGGDIHVLSISRTDCTEYFLTKIVAEESQSTLPNPHVSDANAFSGECIELSANPESSFWREFEPMMAYKSVRASPGLEMHPVRYEKGSSHFRSPPRFANICVSARFLRFEAVKGMPSKQIILRGKMVWASGHGLQNTYISVSLVVKFVPLGLPDQEVGANRL